MPLQALRQGTYASVDSTRINACVMRMQRSRRQSPCDVSCLKLLRTSVSGECGRKRLPPLIPLQRTCIKLRSQMAVAGMLWW